MVLNLLGHVHDTQSLAALALGRRPRPPGRQRVTAPQASALPPVHQLRDELGTSAALWADARHEVEADRWLALSHAASVEFNLVVCHGPHDAGIVAASIAEIAEANVPTLMVLAGEALGSAQVAVDAGWACVGERAFMALRSPSLTVDPAARRATPDDLPAVRAAVAETFGTAPELALVALPEPGTWPPGTEVWLLDDGELRAVTAAVRVGAGLGIWSTATLPGQQGRGYGRRLLESVLAASGADHSVLQSSVVGEPFYRSLGYQVVERWQQWSRPRWVLGRT